MRVSKIFQLLLGSTLGLVFVAIVILGGGFLLVQRLSAPPPRPVFDNERTGNSSTTSAKPSPSASKEPATPEPSPSLEGYAAKVIFSDGLSVRENPSSDAARIGGVDYQEEVQVLEESEDKEWLRIRSQTSGVEGWVRSGNLERVE